MNKSTRWYSNKQEKQIAKAVKGKLQSNSGAGLFKKGDVQNKNWLFEAKTCMKEQQQFTIKKEWLEKLKNESFSMRKEYFALVFNFGKINGENYYILDEKTFTQILEILSEME